MSRFNSESSDGEEIAPSPEVVRAAIEVAKKLRCEDDLYFFLQEAWREIEGGKPFVGGWAVQAICEHAEEVYYGRIKRLLVNIPPRSTKSVVFSVVLPVWCWIKNPSEQIMTLSYIEKLAIRDNVKARRLIKSKWFQDRWGDKITLAEDQDTKTRVDNMQGGYRVVMGLDSGIVGEGSDLMILDDPNTTTNMSEAALKATLSAYTDVLPTRFNDLKTGRMIIVQQRVHERDISGWVIANQGKQFVKLILPMEFESSRRCTTVPLKSTNGEPWSDPRTEEGELLMPERVGQRELKLLKAAMASEYTIAGQLQQRPAPAEGGMIKKAWFQHYKYDSVPKIKFTIQAWDTASSIKAGAAFSACVTMGVFDDEHGYPSLILLGAWRKRVEFPELYRAVQRMGQDYRATTEDRLPNPQFKPDLILIEEKSTGIPIIQTLNKAGLVLTPWRPDKYGDKVERIRKVTHLLEGGRVYVPMQPPDFTRMKRYADVLVSQAIIFPNGDSRDFLDCCSMILQRVINSGWILHPVEESARMAAEHEREYSAPPAKAFY